MCRFKFAFQTVCVLLLFVYGGRLSPHPSGSVPVQIRLSNRLCISALRLTAGGSRRTFPALCRFKLAFQTVCILLRFVYGGRLSPHHFNILSLLFYFVLAKRQCAGSNPPAVCRFKFTFQTVCILLRFVYGERL